MKSNETPGFQPPEDAFDDVEGHGIRSGRIDGPDTDDVEGHALRRGLVEDVEGHMPRVKVPLDGPDTDDVEGHMPRIRIIDGPDTDDVEGHRNRVEGPDTDDVEGHMPLRKVVAEETGEGSNRPSGAPGRSI